MAQRNLTVGVQVTGDTASLNAALAQSQAQAKALQQSVSQTGAAGVAAPRMPTVQAVQAPAATALQQAVQEQTRATQLHGREQQNLTRALQVGRAGMVMQGIGNAFSAVGQVSQGVAIAGAAAMMTGISSLPVVGDQLTNSFAFLRREIGISVIPQMMELSGWLQRTADTYRRLDEATDGAAGKIVFWGTALTGGAAGIYRLSSMLPTGAMGVMAPAAAALAVAADAVYTRQAAQEFATAHPNFAASDPNLRRAYEYNQAASAIPWWGYMANAINTVRNQFEEENKQIPTYGLGAWVGELFGGNAGPNSAQGARVRAMMNPEVQMSDNVEALYNRITMQVGSQSADMAEQDARAMAIAMRQLTDALEASTAATTAATPAPAGP